MIEEITAKLYDLAEEDYRVFNSRLLPGASQVLGVRLPEMRKLAKETAKGDFRAYLEEAQEKITADSIHEEIMVQGLVIGYAKMEKNEYRKYLDEFVPKISNWSVCDSCVSGFKFMRTDPEYWFAYLKTYRESKEEFELRFMIVAMLDYFVDEEHIDEILSICDKIRHNGYYVKMAVAWIIQPPVRVDIADIVVRVIDIRQLDAEIGVGLVVYVDKGIAQGLHHGLALIYETVGKRVLHHVPHV